MLKENELLEVNGGVSLRTLSSVIINAIYIIKTLRLIIKRR